MPRRGKRIFGPLSLFLLHNSERISRFVTYPCYIGKGRQIGGQQVHGRRAKLRNGTRTQVPAFRGLVALLPKLPQGSHMRGVWYVAAVPSFPPVPHGLLQNGARGHPSGTGFVPTRGRGGDSPKLSIVPLKRSAFPV